MKLTSIGMFVRKKDKKPGKVTERRIKCSE